MSQSAAQASQFYQEAVEKSEVWTVKDEGGFPAPLNGEGKRAMPFWSSGERVRKIIKSVNAYAGFEPFVISLQDFMNDWLPSLQEDGLLIGVNWSGARATGYDLTPDEMLQALKYQMEK